MEWTDIKSNRIFKQQKYYPSRHKTKVSKNNYKDDNFLDLFFLFYRNIFKKQSNIKLGDLGLAHIFDTSDASSLRKAGTNSYIAPEMLASSSYDLKVDIW